MAKTPGAAADPPQVFREEAKELLVHLEEALLNLEQTPDRELIGTAFRAPHTIKGSGSMFGFYRVAPFTHFRAMLEDSSANAGCPLYRGADDRPPLAGHRIGVHFCRRHPGAAWRHHRRGGRGCRPPAGAGYSLLAATMP